MNMYLQPSVPRTRQKYATTASYLLENTDFSARISPLPFNHTTLSTWRSGKQIINLSLSISTRQRGEGVHEDIEERGNEGIAPLIRNLGGGELSTWRFPEWVIRMEGELHSRSVLFEEQKIYFPLLEWNSGSTTPYLSHNTEWAIQAPYCVNQTTQRACAENLTLVKMEQLTLQVLTRLQKAEQLSFP